VTETHIWMLMQKFRDVSIGIHVDGDHDYNEDAKENEKVAWLVFNENLPRGCPTHHELKTKKLREAVMWLFNAHMKRHKNEEEYNRIHS